MMRHTIWMTRPRIDSERSRKIAYLRQRTGKSRSEVIKESLDAYFAQLSKGDKPADLLADFIGCADGPSEFSSKYKANLTTPLRRKGRQ